MASLFTYFCLILACVSAGLVAVLCAEILAALFLPPAKSAIPGQSAVGEIAVIVPAHNEFATLAPTVIDIQSQLRRNDRLIIVADNCTDSTAAHARALGVETIERRDSEHVGKGYALDFAINHLKSAPPACVVFIDADCRVSQGSLNELRTMCVTHNRPVQALDLMTAEKDSAINFRVTEFAWRVKNWIRPLGLRNLHLPCRLMGTGMAFPWGIISSVNLASGSIVEDLKLGLDLAGLGHAPMFCPAALVTSHFPQTVSGAAAQRQRWETGHLRMILCSVPGLVFMSITRRNLSLLVLALDLAIPPLSFLAIFLLLCLFFGALAWVLGLTLLPFFIALVSCIALASAVWLSWLNYGRDLLPASTSFAIATYIARKLPLYGRLVFGKGPSRWTRADRARND